MSLYSHKDAQLNLLHSYGIQEVHSNQSEVIIAKPKNAEEAALLLEESIPNISVTTQYNGEFLGHIPQETVRLVNEIAEYNRFDKKTTYRHFSRSDYQNLSGYVVTAKVLGFTPKQIAKHWVNSIGKGNGGASFPCKRVINLRTVKGGNFQYRWYPNRRNHQIEAFVFARVEEKPDGSVYVTTDGYCCRWNINLNNTPKKVDSNGKEFYQLNTHVLKAQGHLYPLSELTQAHKG